MTDTTPDRAAVRLNPDSRPVVLSAVWTVAVLAAVCFALGASGLMAVAGWALVPHQIRWLVPVLLDLGLVIFGLQATVQRARRESTALAWGAVAVLTLASMAAQVAHVIANSDGMAPRWQIIVGAALASAFPGILFLASEQLLAVAVAPRAGRNKKVAFSVRPVTAAPAARARNAGAAAPEVAQPTAPEAGHASGTRDARAGRTRPLTNEQLAKLDDVARLRSQGVRWPDVEERTGVAKTSAQRWAKTAGVSLVSDAA